jgi:hypothetical protein
MNINIILILFVIVVIWYLYNNIPPSYQTTEGFSTTKLPSNVLIGAIPAEETNIYDSEEVQQDNNALFYIPFCSTRCKLGSLQNGHAITCKDSCE